MFLILALCMVFVYPIAKILKLRNLIENKIGISEFTLSNFSVSVMYIINLALIVIMLATIILLIRAFKTWNNLKYYDVTIIKKLDIVALLFIGEGLLIFYSLALTGHTQVAQNKILKVLHIDPFLGLMFLIVGLLFALITSILTNAKLVKDENDLTI